MNASTAQLLAYRAVSWFRQIWINPQKRWAVLGEYANLKNSPYLLADIALRGFVFSRKPAPKDIYEAGKFEGRRELALEIVQLAEVDPAEIFRLVERKPEEKSK